MQNKLVSVIIPTYKRPVTLARAIDSVLNQDYSPIEVIVVDDNNPDTNDRLATEEVMVQYKDKSNVKYIKHPYNKNGSAARNTGAREAKGEYFCFLDDDDEFLPLKIKKQVECLERLDASWGICYCRYIRKNGNMFFARSAERRDGWISFYELCRNFWHGGSSGPLVRKEVFWDVGGFDESFKRNQDYEYMLKITEKYKTAFVDVCGMIMYVDSFHEKQASYYQVLDNFLCTFKKQIEQLDVDKRKKFNQMISLQTIRHELLNEKNIKKCMETKKKNNISNVLFVRYISHLLYRKIFKVDKGFDI